MVGCVEVRLVGAHIKRASKRHTVSGCADTALHVNRGHRLGHVGHVHPEYSLGLLIVEGDIVNRHRDAGVVRAAQTKVGVPYPESVVRRDLQSGRCHQQIRQVLARVVAVQLLAVIHLMVAGCLLHTLGKDFNVRHFRHQQGQCVAGLGKGSYRPN